MDNRLAAEETDLLDRALRAARDTRFLLVDHGARHRASEAFTSAFGAGPAVLVADENTLRAAGKDVQANFQTAGIECEAAHVFGPGVYAEYSYINELKEALSSTKGTPVAVGSGTINDLTKLVSHQLGRPYMAVASAASMDGYTAYGASVTYKGSKQTFDCPAPRAVVADLDVVGLAPPGMNASGYADLLAKGVAGADWILAEAAGEEPVNPGVWNTVQRFLPSWVDSPQGVAQSDPETLRRLVVGLMMSGFAMQEAKTSRPASGADHQFSHLWDMQHHTFQGKAPSHGFKVGIGTLSSLYLYEALLKRDLDRIDVDSSLTLWPSWEKVEARIHELLGSGELADKALEETRAKYREPEALRAQLETLKAGWPALRDRLTRHLKPFRDARSKLEQAGAPFQPEQIGISRDRLRTSYEQAYYIRRRFTILDVAMRLGLFEQALDELFGPEGAWAQNRGQA